MTVGTIVLVGVYGVALLLLVVFFIRGILRGEGKSKLDYRRSDAKRLLNSVSWPLDTSNSRVVEDEFWRIVEKSIRRR